MMPFLLLFILVGADAHCDTPCLLPTSVPRKWPHIRIVHFSGQHNIECHCDEHWSDTVAQFALSVHFYRYFPL
jgi:hypothetical protein